MSSRGKTCSLKRGGFRGRQKNRTVTTNGASAEKTTENPILELFYGSFVRKAPPNKIHAALEKAWAKDPKRTVQVIMNGRDCRGGKGEKKCVYSALEWLRKKKPLTYKKNLSEFVQLGYFKDLLVIGNEAIKKKWPTLSTIPNVPLELVMIAEQLKKDFEKYKKGETISLAAKWAPTEGTHFDHCAKRIAKLMTPEAPDALKQYRLLLTELRKKLNITESLMCANKWDMIQYEHVPSKCHKLNKKCFEKHDSKRYEEYLEHVKSNKKEIKTKGLHPHEIVGDYLEKMATAPDETTEQQWRAFLKKLEEKGSFYNALSVVDVSGSMSGIPMNVAISLGLCVANLTRGPFRNKVITFSSDPTWTDVPDIESKNVTLFQQVEKVQNMKWGMNTNIEKVFQMILNVANSKKIRPEDMPCKLFIFSDMQFDSCVHGNTAMESIKNMYEKANYDLPQIVFWNLNGKANHFPVKCNEQGTALLSGFSADLLQLVLEEKRITPISILEKAIKKYKVVIDNSEM